MNGWGLGTTAPDRRKENRRSIRRPTTADRQPLQSLAVQGLRVLGTDLLRSLVRLQRVPPCELYVEPSWLSVLRV